MPEIPPRAKRIEVAPTRVSTYESLHAELAQADEERRAHRPQATTPTENKEA